MKCLYCGENTGVNNSRWQKKPNQVWRRRHCSTCQGVFTTLEQIDFASSLLYESSPGHVEPFQRDKLFISTYDSLKHRKSATRDAAALTSTVIGKLYPLIKNASIQRADVIKVTTEVLKRFDKAASVQYAAYHPQ